MNLAKSGKYSAPITSLLVYRLKGDQLQRRHLCQKINVVFFWGGVILGTKLFRLKKLWAKKDKVKPDTFQICSRHVPGTFQTRSRHVPDKFQTPSTHLSDNFKTPSRYLLDTHPFTFHEVETIRPFLQSKIGGVLVLTFENPTKV